MDTVSSKVRSQMMSGIRSLNTKPEQTVRKALFAAGFRFRLHRRDLPGVPDVVLPSKKVAVFINGCFWHRHSCRYYKLPTTRTEFWAAKLEDNARRDKKNREALLSLGWRVMTVWECALKGGMPQERLSQVLAKWINGQDVTGEVT